jgi:hypothetical protein
MYTEELRRQWVRRKATDKRHFVKKTTNHFLLTRCGKKLTVGEWEPSHSPTEYYRARYCVRCL